MNQSSVSEGNILIVDDTPSTLEILTHILDLQGYEVRPAISGEVALKAIHKAPPDLILLDIMMPGMDGYEVCQQLKSDETTRDIPIIFLSALNEPVDKVKAFQVGGIDYITKPFHVEEVFARVKTHLTLRNMQKQLQEQNIQLNQKIVAHKHSEEALQRLNRELLLVNQVGQLFSSSLELEKVLETALTEIQRLLNVISSSFWLIEPDTGELVCKQAIGPDSDTLVNQHLTLGQGITGWVAQQGKSLIVPDTWTDERHVKILNNQTELPVRSMLSIPLRIKGEVIGVLNLVDPKVNHFTQDNLNFLEPIAAAAAIAIENARLYTQAQQEITERKRAEEALQQLNDELEERVRERTHRLEEANQVLEETLDTLKKTQEQLIQSEKATLVVSLVAGIAHEVNNPVGVGVTAASHLEQKTQDINALYQAGQMKRSNLEAYLKTATDSAQIILKNMSLAAEHIQSFKTMAVDQASGERRKFNLKKYLDEILLSLKPKLKKTKHTVTVNCPSDIELESYPSAFSQIVSNLVLNSLIHGFEHRAQGEILLDIQHVNGTLKITYRDNGKGIEPEHLAKVFDAFFTTTREQGGSGLGMHIVHNLVTQKLRGQITCESAPGVGTTFIIQMPLGGETNTS